MPQRYATIDEVRALLPASWTDPPITDSLIQRQLDLGQCVIAPSVWGECASQAHALYAAHKVKLSDEAADQPGAGQAGVLASEANGPASRSFFVHPVSVGGSLADAELSMTDCGRAYLEIKRTVLGLGTGIVARTGW